MALLMNYAILDRVNALLGCQSMEELSRTYERFMCHYGFDLFALAFTKPNNSNDQMPFVIGSYDKEWVNHYFDNGYDKIDPVMLKTKNQSHPFLWGDVWDKTELTSKQKVFFNEAKDRGVGYGYSIPIGLYDRSNGLVSLVSSVCKPKEISKVTGESNLELFFITQYFQHIAEHILVKQEKINDKRHNLLNDREVKCLQWAAHGKTDKEIEIIEGISSHTARKHIQTACRKLGVYSRQQACVKAIYLGIIDYPGY